MRKQNKGFTLLEILLVIAAIGILAAIVLVAINPTKQIESARSAQRRSDINSITKAIQQYSIDNNGQYPTGIEAGAKVICNTGSQKSTDTLSPTTLCDNKANLSVLVPTYIASIPQSDSNNYYVRRSNNSIEVSHPRDTIWNIGGTPSLDLNFAKNKSLIDGVSGNKLIDFTRNSTATYVGEDGLIKTAAANEARFDHNPTTRESLGLLIEEERTNLLQYSQDITDAAWGKGNATVTKETLAGPAGTVPYDKITLGTFTNTSGGASRDPVSTSQNVFYTASIYAKAGTSRYIGLTSRNYDSNGWGTYFDLATGVVTQNRGSTTFSILNVGNGWYRLSIGKDVGAGGSYPGFAVIPLTVAIPINGPSNNIQPQYDGNGESLYVWSPQYEAGAFPTSYIPTTTAAVTRAADLLTIGSSSLWFNPLAFTVIADVQGSPATTTTTNSGPGFPYVFSFHGTGRLVGSRSAGSNNGSWAIYTEPPNTLSYNTNANFNSVRNHKVAAAYDALSWQPAADGVMGGAVAPGVNPSLLTTFAIGSGVDGGFWNGTIKRFTYWPTRLSNTTLQSLTQ